jgi:formate dehydrogenase alpha subunit
MNYQAVPTTCPYCACGCGIIIQVLNDHIIGVLPNKSHPVNNGKLCIKGWNSSVFIEHPDRLKNPLIKSGENFREASWEEALFLIAKKYREIQHEFGLSSIAALASGRCTNEENYLMMKFARLVLGTNNIDHCSRLCHASTVTGLAYSFGNGAMTNSIPDLEDSTCFFIIGSNTIEQHPLIARRVLKAKERGAEIIVIDPRKVPMAKFADVYVQHQPGTDVALLNGIMNVILNEHLEDRSFIENRTEGFEDFKNQIDVYPPAKAAELSGVSEEDIFKIARMFASAERGSIIYCMGISQHTTGVDNVRTIANLAMLTGNLGKRGTGVNPLRGQINLQGACDVGALPNVYSGYQRVCELDVENDEIRQKFEDAWKGKLDGQPGLTNVEMFNAAYDGEIKGMHILGGNPALTDPDVNHVMAAIDNLDFLVVHDIFMSETAELADVVLPAASFAEKDGTYTLTDRRVVRIRKAVEPVGNSKPDWWIICELASELGSKAFQYSSPSDVFTEISQLTPIYQGISYNRLDTGEVIQWPCPESDQPGTTVLYEDSFFRGKGLFSPVGFIEPAENPDEEFPLILTTGRVLFQYHTGSSTRRSPKLEQEAPEAFIELHPEDAVKLDVKMNERVKVTSRRGSIEINVRITDRIRPGVVFIPFHYAESPANVLTNFALDPIAKIPELKICAVKVEKISKNI